LGEAKALSPPPSFPSGNYAYRHGCPHIGANEDKKMDEKLKSENVQNLRAITAGRRRERRCAYHIFIQMYFRMHHFVVKFLKFSFPQAARGH